MSPFVRMGARLAALALAMGAASCGVSSPPRPATPDEVAAPLIEPAMERGVVVGLRPMAAAPASESRQRTMAQMLRVSASGGPAGPVSAVEVVVRLERGNRDIAFVRGAEEGFRLGQRVTLTGGEHPQLQRGS
ncbi:hypothetical protein EJV46_09420 [Roseococcus sp. SYP-B2431]|uniref:hypothetical protein n=1 Tax=Roseococcus sp. SYP-B2431 TaxID=2496640 RepID=UPI00103C0BB0|nr:hypothetical protein [Roseococcus sp. SYP-B2431]TCH98776.1 hypothetical protein EJV46_09420 [Roseococcus sp. SYP-B2431]